MAVDCLLPSELPLSVGPVRDVGDGPLVTDVGTDMIGIIALVGNDDGPLLEPGEQRLGAGDVVIIARRDQEADRAALRVDPRVDFRREPPSASAHTTNSTLFLTPEAC